jgi:hypothetical protein
MVTASVVSSGAKPCRPDDRPINFSQQDKRVRVGLVLRFIVRGMRLCQARIAQLVANAIFGEQSSDGGDEAIELNMAQEAKLSRDRDHEARQEPRHRKRAARTDVALRLARRRA